QCAGRSARGSWRAAGCTGHIPGAPDGWRSDTHRIVFAAGGPTAAGDDGRLTVSVRFEDGDSRPHLRDAHGHQPDPSAAQPGAGMGETHDWKYYHERLRPYAEGFPEG